jgi:transposase
MPQSNDLSRSRIALAQDSTIIAVVEMSQASWLVAAMVPSVDRHPLKKLETDQEGLCHRNLSGAADGRHIGLSGGISRDLPLPCRVGSEEAQRTAGDEMALEVKGVVNGGMDVEEALG